MRSHEVYVARRNALGWNKEILAEKTGVDISYILLFENGESVGKSHEETIKRTLNDGFKELSSIEHYKARILELAIEIKNDNNSKENLYRIAHMSVELGKLNRELLDQIKFAN